MTETKEKNVQKPHRGFAKKPAASTQKDNNPVKNDKTNAGAPQQHRPTHRGRPQKQNGDKDTSRKTPLKIISLGGLNEIGKNLTVFECSNDMFIVDCGLAFPDQDMLLSLIHISRRRGSRKSRYGCEGIIWRRKRCKGYALYRDLSVRFCRYKTACTGAFNPNRSCPIQRRGAPAH